MTSKVISKSKLKKKRSDEDDAISSPEDVKPSEMPSPSKGRKESFVPLEVIGERDADFVDRPSKLQDKASIAEEKEPKRIRSPVKTVAQSGGVKKKANPFAKKAGNDGQTLLSPVKVVQEVQRANDAKKEDPIQEKETKKEEKEEGIDAMDIDEPPKAVKVPVELEVEEIKAVIQEERPAPKQADIGSFFKKATITKTDSTAKFTSSIFDRDEKVKEERKAKEQGEKEETEEKLADKESEKPAMKKRGRPKKIKVDEEPLAVKKPARKKLKLDTPSLAKEESFSEQLAQDPKSMESNIDDFPQTIPFKSEPSIPPTLPFLNDRIPADWSLKTWIRFKSATPFDFVDLSPSISAKALKLFATKKSYETQTSAPAEEVPQVANLHFLFETQSVQNSVESVVLAPKEDIAAKIDFDKLLYYYRAPTFAFPQSLVPTILAEREKQLQATDRGAKPKPNSDVFSLWKSSLSDWRASLTSAFEMLLDQGEPSYFFCLYSHLSFVALSPPFASSIEYLVAITKSTKALRDDLEAKGIAFSMPFLPKEKVTAEDPSIMAELSGMSKKILDTPIKKIHKETVHDLTDESMLVILGKENLRLLSAVVGQYLEKASDHSYELPTILSRFPFMNSAIQRVEVDHKQITAANSGNGALETFHQLLLSGPIFPEVAMQLCERIKSSQKELNATLEVDQTTLLFNKFLSAAVKLSANITSLRSEERNFDAADFPSQLTDPIRIDAAVKRIHWTDQTLDIDYI